MAMLEQLVHSVESGLAGLGRHLFRPGLRERLQDDIERRTAELQGRHAELSRSRIELAGMKRRLRDNPTTAALLHSRIEKAIRDRQTDQAYRLALELDQLRQTMNTDQETCPRLEQKCWSLQFLIRQLERRLARLQDQLYPH
jgi:chromosome segregation ATPase